MVTFEGKEYKVKGNTLDDAGNEGPTVNKCIAKKASLINLTIEDVTYHNHVSGNPFRCYMTANDNFILGINTMIVILYFNGEKINFTDWENKNTGLLPIEITDLGTPITGILGTSNVAFGNTLKGKFNGNIFTFPKGSRTPHRLIMDFKAVRQY